MKCKNCQSPIHCLNYVKFCSNQCRQQYKIDQPQAATPPREKRHKKTRCKLRKRRVTPQHFYVYGWKYSSQKFPFYVGQGQRSRAWAKHMSGGESANCQAYYDRKRTEVVVYKDNLTKEGALLVEAVLIRLFADLGATLANVGSPMKRQERPPLTIAETSNLPCGIGHTAKSTQSAPQYSEKPHCNEDMASRVNEQRRHALTVSRQYAMRYGTGDALQQIAP